MLRKTIRRAAAAFLAAAIAITAMPQEIAASAVVAMPQETAASAVAAMPMGASASIPSVQPEALSGESAQKITRVSVHDPSIIKADGTYYLFGTHLADAKSTDLMNWTQMNLDWNARGDDSWKQDSVYGNVLENLAESFAWAGYNDGDTANGGLGV
ncbi:MAG: hypothetical protein HFH40_00890 [Lachnospiraceae bacterium]|nr:hypothetical protein [Lachnospiraceae bacterium]